MTFSQGVTFAVVFTAGGVLLIGIFPGYLYDLAVNSVKIFPGLTG